MLSLLDKQDRGASVRMDRGAFSSAGLSVARIEMLSRVLGCAWIRNHWNHETLFEHLSARVSRLGSLADSEPGVVRVLGKSPVWSRNATS